MDRVEKVVTIVTNGSSSHGISGRYPDLVLPQGRICTEELSTDHAASSNNSVKPHPPGVATMIMADDHERDVGEAGGTKCCTRCKRSCCVCGISDDPGSEEVGKDKTEAILNVTFDDGLSSDNGFPRLSQNVTENELQLLERKWKHFPGKNKFYLDGRLMTAPSVKFCMLSFLLILVTFVLFIAVDGPYFAREISIAIPITGGVLFVLVIVNMFKTSCSDPGILPRASQQESEFVEKSYAGSNGARPPPRTKDIIVKGQTIKSKYCFTCKMFRPPRASHCSVCDNCVDRFDHHCPFLGNCIGKRNYRNFYAFIVCLSLLAIFVLSFSITKLAMVGKERGNFLDALKESPTSAIVILISFLGMWTVIGLAGFHTYLIAVEQTTNEDGHKLLNKLTSKLWYPYNTTKGYLIKSIFTAVFFNVLLAEVAVFSSKNALRPMYHHIKGMFGRANTVNPYSKGNFCQNCCFILCGPYHPSLIDSRGVVTPDFLASLPKRNGGNDSMMPSQIPATSVQPHIQTKIGHQKDVTLAAVGASSTYPIQEMESGTHTLSNPPMTFQTNANSNYMSHFPKAGTVPVEPALRRTNYPSSKVLPYDSSDETCAEDEANQWLPLQTTMQAKLSRSDIKSKSYTNPNHSQIEADELAISMVELDHLGNLKPRSDLPARKVNPRSEDTSRKISTSIPLISSSSSATATTENSQHNSKKLSRKVPVSGTSGSSYARQSKSTANSHAVVASYKPAGPKSLPTINSMSAVNAPVALAFNDSNTELTKSNLDKFTMINSPLHLDSIS